MGWDKTKLHLCPDCGQTREIRFDSHPDRCGECSRKKSLATARHRRWKEIHQRHINLCIGCGKEFLRCQTANGKYCSKDCQRKAQSVDRICKRCARTFNVPRSKISGKTNSSANFCSISCYHLFLGAGESSRYRGPRWIAAKREAIRRNPFCAICGKLKHLHVHHIIPYRISKDSSQENLIALCPLHHRNIENIYLETEPFEIENLEEMLYWRRVALLERQAMTRLVLQKLIKDEL